MEPLGDVTQGYLESLLSRMPAHVRERALAGAPGKLASDRPLGASAPGDEGDPDCPECGGVGLVSQGGRIHQCRCYRDRTQARLWNASGLEPDEQTYTLEYFEGKAGKGAALTAARACLERSPSAGLVTFYGEFGRGKSGMLKAIVAEFIRRGGGARYVSAARVLMTMRDTFGDHSGESEGDVFNRYASARVLAIDEFDVIPETGWAYTAMRSLLDERCRKTGTALTLLATNADVTKMPEHWRYMQSRMEAGERVKVGGVDLRQRPTNLRMAGT